MAKIILTFLLVRILLPVALLLSIAIRPFGLSNVYLLLFLLSPMPRIPDAHTWTSIRGKFLLIVVVISSMLLLVHVTWHTLIALFRPRGAQLTEDHLVRRIGHNLGLVSYHNIDPLMGVHYLAPELVMTIVSIAVYTLVKKITREKEDDEKRKDTKYQQFPLIVSAGKYLALFLIMFSGIMWPSVTSGIYFLTFMGAATMWALDRLREKAFAVVGRCVMAIMAVHSLILIGYQNNWATELYPPEKEFSRYFGLIKLVNLNETNSQSFDYVVSSSKQWTSLASPLVILVTYYVLAIETRELFKPKVVFEYINSKTLRGDTSETTPLIRRSSSKRYWSSFKTNSSTKHAQDSTGSVVLVDEDSDAGSQSKSNLLSEIISAVIELFQVLVRSSYIATTITMMAWSILYHSWLTFVFLMWANLVWLCQDQRRFMLQTSPILVVYAMFLLIAQYIYGMQLTESEMPSDIADVNLSQIGLGRSKGDAFVPLLIKSMFTCMFWVTLRQRVQEKRARRQASALADMAAPVQLTVSTAASVIEAEKEKQGKSRILTAVGDFLRAACARYWIYVVAIMLFVIGITGERMTIFRIIYMFLFLAFILMFQISWYWWRRLMYVFWIVVIIYSMINLILLYVYQFDNFSKIISEYLFINEKLQHDLGLEQYTPADLFVKLLTPTLFLIITIMQVHYFHKNFMQLSDHKSGTNKDAESSRPSQGASTIKDDIPQLPEDEHRASPVLSEPSASPTSYNTGARVPLKSSIRSYGATSLHTSVKFRPWLMVKLRLFRQLAIRVIDGIFEYLDIHLTTVVFVALMLLCVFNVCAMHVPIMILSCFALTMAQRKQRFIVLLISTLISVFFMAKMVYQIDYIDHEYFSVNCNDTQNPANASNAAWVGFTKTTPTKNLATILTGYICLFALFTFNSLVKYRQQSYREKHGIEEVDNEAKLPFPEITRVKADIDLIHCIKYLINYGFYKFGVEITLICMIGVIGSRMDMYSVIYAGWLLLLVSIKRKTQAKIWTVFVVFLTIVVPLQYLLVVGFLPQFCITYPWGGLDTQMKHVRNWAFLPYPSDPPHAAKLIFDYFLLLFATLQLRVFNIEKTYGENYPGGSNSESVGEDWETPSFDNPVPDFLGFVGTWLDIFKRMVFLGMLWVTLAIMFMTGTNRVNLFSLGYLVGSFIFLWQGTDFYLLPKDSILSWWSWLLRYNVCVVYIKAMLQIPGCMFSTTMNENACWLVQLLGIGCVDKFAGGSITKFLKMDRTSMGLTTTCSLPQEDIGLAWDGVCFAFLILQRRLFLSYYFYRVIDESKATTVLASRGAELIEELRMKQMKLQEEQELNILEKIKVKMEKIKANQRKIQGSITKEPIHHDAEEDEEDTQHVESECVPLVRGDSDASGRGYHTPDSPTSPHSPRGFHTPLSEPSAPSSPARTPPPTSPRPPPLPILPPPSSHGGPPSPSSALLTSLSLDAYLEPRRISFGSPPSSDLLPRAQSPEESYPVFSPPPIRRRHTVASPSLLQRTSVISQSSRSEPKSHHTSRECPPYKPPASHQKAVRSGDYYMFDEFDDTEDVLQEAEEAPDVDAPQEMGLGKLVSTVFKTDLKRALSLRRASMPSMQRRLSGGVSTPPETRSLARSTAEAGPSRHSAGPPTDGSRGQTALEDIAPTPEIETRFEKFKRVCGEVPWAFISSFLASLTRHLMKYSRDYRYVSRTLTLEKKVLKEKDGFGIGLREGSQMRWEPLPETLVTGRKLSDISVPEIRILAPSMERGLDASPAPSRRSSRSSRSSRSYSPSNDDEDTTSEHESAFSLQTTGSKDVSLLEEHDDSMFKKHRSIFVHLIFAIWYAILAHTDIVCYIMVFINQIQSATILSIPLPLMVFLWGTLTIPRPTKTFWVTLIAYTEVIVLIKSMFQFEIMPWNQNAIPDNMPFTAPRIIGIERKSNYALYDLLLLLIIFLHRFMLKSLGLWKETTPEIELREDMEFPLKPEDTQQLVEGRGEDVGKKYMRAHDLTGPSPDKINEEPDAETTELTESEALQDEEPGPSKPPDDHFKVNDDQEPIIAVTTTIDDPYTHFPGIIWLSLKRYVRPTLMFFKHMTGHGARVTADVYAYMFLCDFVNFLVVIFGFAAFGTQQGDGGVTAYLEENKVPIPFLVMLILQFVLIVVDRALYLRKCMLGKILFQYALIIGVHIWMFFVLPFITERTFNTLTPPPMWYMMKCIYLLLSAYQIRCGYPRRIIGNFLCKSYRFLNMLSFRCFMAVPFVFELRTLMDWIWTDTSMTLMDWLKMEDIFANVFLLKCSRFVEDEFPSERGEKKSNVAKYILGGTVLAFVIAIIWFPLVFFAFGNTVGQPNPPTDVTVKIRIGPFLPIYQMSAQSKDIQLYSESDYSELNSLFASDRTAQTFLSNYMYNDVAVVSLNANSTMKWDISPPELDRLEREAESNNTLTVKFTFVITRKSNNPQNPPTIEESREVELPAFDKNGQRSSERVMLTKMLTNKTDPHDWLRVGLLFPKFLKVFNKGTAKAAYQLTLPLEPVNALLGVEDRRLYRDVLMRLERDRNAMYWRVRENCTKEFMQSYPRDNCDMLVMFTFNDKLFPETLNFISGGGIIGLYTTFVFLASRVIRGFFSGIYTKIMFDDLPNVDRVLQLCLDIYLVREALEMSLEEDLFAKLVFLYRSPETMIKWSRPREEDDTQRALPPPPPQRN